MSHVLAQEKTKHALAELHLTPLQKHLKSRGLRYIVAGNHKTFISDDNIDMANNHEEGDTLHVYCLHIAPRQEYFSLRDRRRYLCSLGAPSAEYLVQA